MIHLKRDSLRALRALVLVGCVSGLFSACGDNDFDAHDKVFGPAAPRDRDAEPPDHEADAGDPRTDGDASQESCGPVVASEHIPARESVLAEDGAGQIGTDQGVFTKALFDEFKRHCGDCHSGTAAHGGLSADLSTFPSRIGANAVARIRSDAAGVGGFMPPAPQGGPFSKRPANDPMRAFAARLEAWVAQGSPADVFFPDGKGNAAGSSKNSYRMSKAVGMQLTNLGNCVPAPKLMGTEQSAMAELDAKFAAMKSFEDLPKDLTETDMTSFDAEALAEQSVIAFAPAYTLWADYAKKLRTVRVPRGESIRFNPDTQSFDIPANTRFYKTFLKETIDLNGQKRYRKMETRIIVARPAVQAADGSTEQTALFGSYKWNEDETQAILQDKPYRDGKGFVDEVYPYVVDERLDDEVLRKGPKDQLAARLKAGSMRNYAIPGFDRCVHCHMGSPMQNFILGFMPLQLQRRAMGEGGVVEPAERDELNQVQRLIDYGVITGMNSPDEITLLEASQGDRKPRNEHELKAQGYMLGNCAHCHNPIGFPSIKEPVLKNALNFLPGGEGGIFQFPLDKFSPRTFRGANLDIPVPYITPSLYDLPTQAVFGASEDKSKFVYDDKWKGKDFSVWRDAFWNLTAYPDATLQPGWPLLAPWRSLIYRNVDTPFSYEDLGTIFPHMPMDTPGYDCRARQLLGSWMVSIPAIWKKHDQVVPVASGPKRLWTPGLDEFFSDTEAQPYVEVKPDDPGFLSASFLADASLSRFQASERFNDCPAPSLDPLDPVVATAGTGLPAAQQTEVTTQGTTARYAIAAPARPHYFETDLRVNASWIIRRGDWYEVLSSGEDPYVKGTAGRSTWSMVYNGLKTVRVNAGIRASVLQRRPAGLWQDKPECASKFSAAQVARAGDVQPDARPEWMKYAPKLQDESPVYMASDGEMVFDLICSKCHGPNGDGQSSLASTMADLTGGLTRVANLRDGLFGPASSPGSNRTDAVLGFGKGAGASGLTVEDWAARYTIWMGMGGTRANIPKAVVGGVGRATVFGEKSGVVVDLTNVEGAAAANMLTVAQLSCQALAPDRPRDVVGDAKTYRNVLFDVTSGKLAKDPTLTYTVTEPGRGQTLIGLSKKGLLTTNGHAELWERLCVLVNPLPVRVVSFERQGEADLFYVSALFRREAYPSGAPVGDGTGRIVSGLDANNLSPWCVTPPVSPDLIPAFTSYQQQHAGRLPVCPNEVASPESAGRIRQSLSNDLEGDPDVYRWSLRGAMNAGLAVYVYLDAVSKGQVTRQPAYDRCQELAP